MPQDWGALQRSDRRPDVLAAHLMGHLRTAAPLVSAGGTFTAHDDTNWGMSTQRLEGRPTGKLIVVCFDPMALARFIEHARTAGHTVEATKQHHTVIVTPKHP